MTCPDCGQHVPAHIKHVDPHETPTGVRCRWIATGTSVRPRRRSRYADYKSK